MTTRVSPSPRRKLAGPSSSKDPPRYQPNIDANASLQYEGWTFVSRKKPTWLRQERVGNVVHVHNQGNKVYQGFKKTHRQVPGPSIACPQQGTNKSTNKISTGWHFAPGISAMPWNKMCQMGRKMEEDYILDYGAPYKDHAGKSIVSIPRYEIPT